MFITIFVMFLTKTKHCGIIITFFANTMTINCEELK